MITAPKRQLVISITAICLAGIIAAGLSTFAGPASARVMTVFFISLIAVVGMGVYSGNSGILSFGHLAFMGIGAYASSLLTVPSGMKAATLPNLPDWLATTQTGLFPAIIAAILLVSLVALVLGLALGRLEGSAATISTLGLLIIVHGVAIGWRDVTRGAQTFFGVPRLTDVWVAAIGCIVALVVARLYRDSISGLRLRAGRDNAIAASAVGIRIRHERLIAWVLSAAIMALSGALLAHFLGAFSPKKFYFVDTFFLLAMLIVGGMTTVTGAITGAVVITIVVEFLRRIEGGFNFFGMDVPAIFGTTQIGIALIILISMFRKAEGIAGTREWEERLLPADHSSDFGNVDKAATVNSRTGVLDAKTMTMKFGGLVAVNDVSLTVRPGEILGLIGPNGSGKTTLLNMLSGVLVPTSGNISLAGKSINGKSSAGFSKLGIARTFQNIRLFNDLDVWQNIHVAALSTDHGKNAEARTISALSRLEIADLSGRDAGALSYGQQRRVEIARALACNPSLLFLDEPAAGMNREETDALMDILRGLARQDAIGILLVDHDLKLINQLCDRIVVLNEGHLIAAGTPDEIRNDTSVREAYLGRKHGDHQT